MPNKPQDNATSNGLDASIAKKIAENREIINKAIARKNKMISGSKERRAKIVEANNQIANDYDLVIKKIQNSQIFINHIGNKVEVFDLSKPGAKKYLLENVFPSDLREHLSVIDNYPAFKVAGGNILIKFPDSSLHKWSLFSKLDYLTREMFEQVRIDMAHDVDTTQSVAFTEGYTYNSSIHAVKDIEGFADSMTLTAMKQLAIKLYQDPKSSRAKLGGLFHYIDNKENKANPSAVGHQGGEEPQSSRLSGMRTLYNTMCSSYKTQYIGYLSSQKKNLEFQEGANIANYTHIKIPGYVSGMSVEQMRDLFIEGASILERKHPLSSDLTLNRKELGALAYRIKAASADQVKIPEYRANMSLKEVVMLYLQYVEKVDSTPDQLEALSYFIDKAVDKARSEDIQIIKSELEDIVPKSTNQRVQIVMRSINGSSGQKQKSIDFIDQELIDFALDDGHTSQSSKNQSPLLPNNEKTSNGNSKNPSALMPSESSSPEVLETPIVTVTGQVKGNPDVPMNTLAYNPDSERLLANHEAKYMADAFWKASVKLYQEHKIPIGYIPVIESITKSLNAPNTYEITFYDPNSSDVNAIRKIETTKPIFNKTKQYLNRLTKNQSKVNHGRIPAGTGLSVFFAIRILLSSNENTEWSRMNPISQNLATAVQLHHYFNLTGLGVGVLQDGMVVASMGTLSYLNHLPPRYQADFKYLVRQENLKSFIQVGTKIGLDVKPLEKALPRIIHVAEKISNLAFASKLLVTLGKVLPVVNTGFYAASTGFDTYQLVHAENSHQQKVFGVQLATSLVCLGLSTGGLIAVSLGASATAGPLFIITLPIAVTGGGIAQSMQYYDNIEQLIAHRVLNYFDQVAGAYDKGYSYDKEKDMLVIRSGAVVKEIDFETGHMTLGNQYLCSRDRNDLRRVSSDHADVINLRTAFGGNDSINLSSGDRMASVIVLPDTPMSYVSYNTANIQALNAYTGDRYKNIRRIESHGFFTLEYFVLFHDNIVHKLFHQYQPTEVEVKLDGINRVLIIPELPTQTAKVLNRSSTIRFSNSVNDFDDDKNNNHQLETLPNAITYKITGKGAQYTIGLNEGATLYISTASAKPSRWIFNTTNLDKDEVEIQSDRLIIGGVVIHIDSAKNNGSEIIVVKQDGDIYAIDIHNKSSKVIQLDAEKWGEKQAQVETFDAHLKKLAQEGHFVREYIPVSNYTYGDEKVVRAYYDVKKDRMLFSRDAQIDGSLGAIVGENVYFYNKEHELIWKTNIVSGEVKEQYHIYEWSGLAKDGVRIWEQNNQVYVALDYTYNTENKGELIYHLKADLMELVSLRIDNSRADIFKQQSLLSFYTDAKFEDSDDHSFRFPQAKMINRTQSASWVIIYDDGNKDSSYRYWLRTSDKMLVKPNLTDMSSDKAMRIKFIGSIKQAEKPELFYFLDPFENALYSQEGADSTMPNAVQSMASRVNGSFAGAEVIESSLFATTKEGLIYQVGIKGDLILVAVNEQWLSQQGKNWCRNLQTLSDDTSLIILGLKDVDKKGILPAWYIGGGLVVVAPTLVDHAVQLLEVYEHGFALLFDSTTNRLYKQKKITNVELLRVFGDYHIRDSGQQLVHEIELLPSQEFKSVSKNGDIIRLVTKEGVILSLNHTGKLQLIGVDQAWQAAHVDDESAALSLLGENIAWSSGKFIVLQGVSENSTPAWYHFDLKLRIDASDLTVSDKPELIGMINRADGVDVYIASQTGDVWSYNYSKSSSSGTYQFVDSRILHKNILTQRLGEALFMGGTDRADDLNPLALDGVTSVVLSGGDGEDNYSASEQVRKKIKEIRIDNYASDKAKDKFKFYVNGIDETVLLHKDNDLLFCDADGIVSLGNVFGENKADYNHMELVVDDGVKQAKYTVAGLVTQMESYQSNSINSSYFLPAFDQSS